MTSEHNRIAFRLFGTVELRTTSGAKAHTLLAQLKPVAMLAILASARGSSVRRDRLVGLLWPELDDARARNALSKAIHTCRRALGDDAFNDRFAEDVGLNVDRWTCDVWDFEDQLQSGDTSKALESFLRGEWLDGFNVPDTTALEHWIAGERIRLSRKAVNAVIASADDLARSGDMQSAVAQLDQVEFLVPYDEQFLCRRLRLLDQAGNRAEAINVYAAFSDRLQRELNTAPSPETVALVDAIRQRESTVSGNTSRQDPLARAEPFAESKSSGDLTPDVARDGNRRNPPSMRRWRSAGVAAGIAIGIGLAASVGFLVRQRQSPSPADRLASVIVTPFMNNTKDTSLAIVGELAADMLNAALSQAGVASMLDPQSRIRHGLSVFGANTVTENERMVELARAAGATTIVTGQYYRAGSSIVVLAFIRGLDGKSTPLSFAEESGPVADPREALVKVQRRLIGIFAARDDAPKMMELASHVTWPTHAAYAEYMIGLRAYIGKEQRSALAHLENAYALDSTFVSLVPLLYDLLRTHGMAARADSLLKQLSDRRSVLLPYDQSQLDIAEAFNNGKREALYAAALRAYTLAPHSAGANWQLGFAAVTTNRFTVAVDAFKRLQSRTHWTQEALFSSIHWQSLSLHLLGDHRAERLATKAALEAFPFESEACLYHLKAMAPTEPLGDLAQLLNDCVSRSGGADSAWIAFARLKTADELLAHHRQSDAVAFTRPAVAWYRAERVRDTSYALRMQLAQALMTVGEWEEALPLFETEALARPDSQPPRFAANAAIAATQVGQHALANEILERLRSKPHTAQFAIQRARILAHMGRKSDAVAELQRALELGSSAAEVFHARFGLLPLVGYPDYESLVKPRN